MIEFRYLNTWHFDTGKKRDFPTKGAGNRKRNGFRDMDTQKSESRFLFKQRTPARVSELAWHPSSAIFVLTPAVVAAPKYFTILFLRSVLTMFFF